MTKSFYDLVPSAPEGRYDGIERPYSVEDVEGGSINSNSSLTKFSIILMETSLRISIGLESIGRIFPEIPPKIFSSIDIPLSLHKDAIL